jgi:hypothetical protein
VAEKAIAYFARRGMDLGKLRWDEFAEFSRRCLVPLDLQLEGYTLYRMRSRAERQDRADP